MNVASIRYRRPTARQRAIWRFRQDAQAADVDAPPALHRVGVALSMDTAAERAVALATDVYASLDCFAGHIERSPDARYPAFNLASAPACVVLDDRAWDASAIDRFQDDALASTTAAGAWIRHCPGDGQDIWLFAVDSVYCDLAGLYAWVETWVENLAGQVASNDTPSQDFSAVVRWQEALLDAPQARMGIDYWLGHHDRASHVDPRIWPRDDASGSREGEPRCDGSPSASTPIVDIDTVAIAVERVAAALDMPPGDVFTACWLHALWKYAGGESVSVGFMVDGRPLPGFVHVAGCLRRPVPLTIAPRAASTVRDAFATLSRTLAAHRRFQGSFDWTRLDRDEDDRDEDFPFLCDERPRFRSPEGARLIAVAHADDPCIASFAYGFDTDGKLAADILYDARRLRDSEARDLATYLQDILLALPDRIDAPLDAWLARRRRSDLSAWQGASPIASPAIPVFDMHAHARMENAEGQRLEHDEIEAAVGRRAAYLRDLQGTRNEAVLAIIAKPSTDVVFYLLASLRIGMPFALLDPAWPVSRTDSVLARLDTVLVLSDDAQGGPGRVRFDDVRIAEAHPGRMGAVGSLPGASAAYLACTSGSTGEAKIVVVTREALANQLRWLAGAIGLTPDDRVLQRTVPSFDAAIWELLLPPLGGAESVFVAEEDLRVDRLAATLMRRAISVVQATPSLLRRIAEADELPACDALRVIVAGGERLSLGLVGALREATSATIHNAYGPTECTIQVTMHPIGEVSGDPGDVASIGLPMAGCDILLLDDALDPATRGAVGELCVAGLPLARGYLDSSAGTAERFVPDPRGSGTRLYRTGDMARERIDGTIDVVGRNDRQFKVNGVRIEPADVESVLRQVGGVEDALVSAVYAQDGSGHLLAFLVTRDSDRDVDVEKRARAHVATRLPAALCPARYLRVDDPPVSANGKLDAVRLLALAEQAPTMAETAPRTPTERDIADIWRGVLRRDGFGVHDSFFALGGHSLLFAQAVTRVRDHFGVDVPLRAIFDHPTIASLAEQVDALLARRGAAHV